MFAVPSRSIRHCVFAATLVCCSVLALSQTSKFPPPEPQHPESESDQVRRREEWFLKGRIVAGKNAAALLSRAHRQKLALRRAVQSAARAAADQAGVPLTTAGGASGTIGPPWTNLGPAPITGNSTGTTNPSFSGGPEGNFVGRITSIAIDPNDATANTVYVAGAYGGVWRTRNGNASPPTSVKWTPLFDTDAAAATLSVGALTVLPCIGACGANGPIILAGTGEADSTIDSYYGQGILRFDPGSNRWSLIASADSGAHSFKGIGFTKFAFNSSNPNLVVAAAASAPAPIGTVNGNGLTNFTKGPYVSTDGGKTWSLASIFDPGNIQICVAAVGFPEGCSVTDVIYDPAVNTFFAAIRFHGIYASTNGATWTRVTDSGLTASLSNCPSSASSNCPMFRGELAVQPATGDLYLVYVSGNGTSSDTTPAIFRAAFSGGRVQNWVSVFNSGIMNCGDGSVDNGCGASQGFFDLYIAAEPNGSNTDLYFGAVNLFKCSNPAATAPCHLSSGSNAWLNVTHVYNGGCSSTYQTMHPDNHAIAFKVVSGKIVTYFGNDGGVYRSQNSAAITGGTGCSGSGNLLDDLNTSSLGSLSQFIAISTHPSDASITLGGTQDNGSPATAGGQTQPPLPVPLWFEANGGDGGYNIIDPAHSNLWYTANTDVSIQLCNQGPACIETAFFNAGSIGPAQVGGDHGAFYTPYILDPASTTNVIVGTCRVLRGPANNTSLKILSNNFDTRASTVCSGGEVNILRSLAAGGPTSGGLSQVIYAGTDAGRIFVTTNAAGGPATWVDRTGGINPNGFPISSIAIDNNPALGGQTAYATVMGFTGGGGHVFKTANAGATWSDISGTLPDVPANAVLLDPGDHTIVYVATDVGVFVTSNGGTNWQEWGSGLPNVAVLSLAVAPGSLLRAGTYGRGVFQVALASAHGYSLTISNSPLMVYQGGANGTFQGTAIALGSFNSTVNLSCTSGITAPPGTCKPSPASLTPTTAGTPFTVAVNDFGGTEFIFNIHGVGTDANSTARDALVTLSVADFAVDAPPVPTVIERTSTAMATIGITPFGNVIDTLTFSCAAPLPTGISCVSFSPASVVPGQAHATSQLLIAATSAAALGPVAITVQATGSLPGAPTRTAAVSLEVVPGLGFVPVTPCRAFDTRLPGSGGGAIAGNASARVFVMSNNTCGIPATALAYALNLTVVPHGPLGFLSAFPCDQTLIGSSNLNSLDGRVKAVAAIVSGGSSGLVCVFASNTTDLIIDINGYFVPSNDSSKPLAFFPLTPCRLVDTRESAGSLGGPFLAANSTRDFPLLSSANCSIPTAAKAYSLNYTAVPRSSTLGFLTTWPTGVTQPGVSTLNAPTGTVTANAAIVPAGTNGDVNVFVTNDSDLVIDINGYFADPVSAPNPLSFYSLPPCRVLDTRNSSGAFSGQLDVGVTASGCGAPAAAQAFVLNATVVPAGTLGFLKLWPQGAAQPLVSTLNAIDGKITSNLAIVPTTNGSISTFSSNSTQLILDLSGYFGP